jgi:hypothetical protein
MPQFDKRRPPGSRRGCGRGGSYTRPTTDRRRDPVWRSADPGRSRTRVGTWDRGSRRLDSMHRAPSGREPPPVPCTPTRRRMPRRGWRTGGHTVAPPASGTGHIARLTGSPRLPSRRAGRSGETRRRQAPHPPGRSRQRRHRRVEPRRSSPPGAASPRGASSKLSPSHPSSPQEASRRRRSAAIHQSTSGGTSGEIGHGMAGASGES